MKGGKYFVIVVFEACVKTLMGFVIYLKALLKEATGCIISIPLLFLLLWNTLLTLTWTEKFSVSHDPLWVDEKLKKALPIFCNI